MLLESQKHLLEGGKIETYISDFYEKSMELLMHDVQSVKNTEFQILKVRQCQLKL